MFSLAEHGKCYDLDTRLPDCTLARTYKVRISLKYISYLSGEANSIFSVAPFSIITLQGKNLLLQEQRCSCRSKFFPLRVDSNLEELCYPG